MRNRPLLLPLTLALTGAVRTPVIAPGTYTVDLATWRADAIRKRPALTVNGIRVPLSDSDRDRWLDDFAKVLASATLEVRQDGTYILATPMFDMLGTWVASDGQFHGSSTIIHAKVYGLTYHSEPFSICREGTSLRLASDDKPSDSIPIQRLSTTAAR